MDIRKNTINTPGSIGGAAGFFFFLANRVPSRPGFSQHTRLCLLSGPANEAPEKQTSRTSKVDVYSENLPPETNLAMVHAEVEIERY